MDNYKHIPVLLEECITGLNIKEDGIYVDGTLGGAGHSKEILKRLDSSKGFLVGIDRDEEALKAAKQNLKEFENVNILLYNELLNMFSRIIDNLLVQIFIFVKLIIKTIKIKPFGLCFIFINTTDFKGR